MNTSNEELKRFVVSSFKIEYHGGMAPLKDKLSNEPKAGIPTYQHLLLGPTMQAHFCPKGSISDAGGKQEDGVWSERMASRPTVRMQVVSQTTPSKRIHPVRRKNG